MLSRRLIGGTLVGGLALARIAGAEPPPDPDGPVRGRPRLHIETDYDYSDVMLMREPGPLNAHGARGTPICQPPCDRVIDARDGSHFFVEVGNKDRTSDRFPLRYSAGDVTLKVGNRYRRRAGIGLTVAGAVLVPASVATAYACFVQAFANGLARSVAHPKTPPPAVDPYFAGVLTSAAVGTASAIALVVGIALIVDTRTQIQLVNGRGIPLGRAASLDGLALRF